MPHHTPPPKPTSATGPPWRRGLEPAARGLGVVWKPQDPRDARFLINIFND